MNSKLAYKIPSSINRHMHTHSLPYANCHLIVISFHFKKASSIFNLNVTVHKLYLYIWGGKCTTSINPHKLEWLLPCSSSKPCPYHYDSNLCPGHCGEKAAFCPWFDKGLSNYWYLNELCGID